MVCKDMIPPRDVIDDKHLNMIKYLIENCGCIVEMINDEQCSVFINAVESGNIDVVKYILEIGKDDIIDTSIEREISFGNYCILLLLTDVVSSDQKNTMLINAASSGKKKWKM